MSSIHATWNARMAQGSYGGGQPQGTSGSLGPLGEQPQEAAQYSLPGPTVAPSTASLEDRLQRLPTGQVCRQPHAALDVESQGTSGSLGPLGEQPQEAARYSLPGPTVAPSTASLEDWLQRLPTGQVRLTPRAALALNSPNSMMIDMDVIILNTTVALQNLPPGRKWTCDLQMNQAVAPQTGPSVRVDKRARKEQNTAAAKQQRKASKADALRQRMATLCADFRERKVRGQVPERSTYVDTHGTVAERGYALRQGGAPGARTGNGAGSARALGIGRSMIFQCPTCYAMVDLRAASRAATRADREVRAGDGCLGCNTRCKPGVYIETQLNRLEALRDGMRILVRIPTRSLDMDGECNRRLCLGMTSLCMRAEAALRTVARVANVPCPSD